MALDEITEYKYLNGELLNASSGFGTDTKQNSIMLPTLFVWGSYIKILTSECTCVI